MANTKFILREDKTGKNGKAPIYMRIYQDGKTVQISIEERIHPEQWNTAGKVKRNHPNSTRLNHKLDTIQAKIKDALLAAEHQNLTFSSADFKDILRGYKKTDFFQFARKMMDRKSSQWIIVNQRKRESHFKKFSAFLGRDAYPIANISIETLYDYELYLKSIGNKVNTIYTNMKTLKMIFRAAVREDIITESQNPFNHYKLKTEKTFRTYLVEDEIDRIKALDLSDSQRVALARDMFLFAIYAGGMRVSDLLLLKQHAYRSGKLTYRMFKTKEIVQDQPIAQTARDIAEKYINQNPDPGKYLFPFVDPSNLATFELDRHRIINLHTTKYNKLLKIVALRADIHSKLTSHVARHTFATLMLSKDQSIETVGRILRHSNIRETQIYAKVMDKAVETAMSKLL